MNNLTKNAFLKNVLILANVIELATRTAQEVDPKLLSPSEEELPLKKSVISSTVYNSLNKLVKEVR